MPAKLPHLYSSSDADEHWAPLAHGEKQSKGYWEPSNSHEGGRIGSRLLMLPKEAEMQEDGA